LQWKARSEWQEHAGPDPGERLNAQRVMEPESNPFLAAFYEGERGAAFQAQFAFLVQRFEQLQALDLAGGSQKIVVAITSLKKTNFCLPQPDRSGT